MLSCERCGAAGGQRVKRPSEPRCLWARVLNGTTNNRAGLQADAYADQPSGSMGEGKGQRRTMVPTGGAPCTGARMSRTKWTRRKVYPNPDDMNINGQREPSAFSPLAAEALLTYLRR
jgi:hypothetical protein